MQVVKFDTITKRMIWGSEYWILSAVEQAESVVTYPETARGMTLKELIGTYKEKLVGKKNWMKYGRSFPLLIKFIEADQDLSIQVHPNDEYAWKHHGKFGKNEMWYILQAEADTCFHVGFNRTITPREYEERIGNSTILGVLNDVPVAAGDVIYLPAGRVHSIGGGSRLLEVQQSSDVTYRIFDYNRRDAAGNLRELHTAQAKDVLDFEVLHDCKCAYVPMVNEEVKLVDVPYFTTSLFILEKSLVMDYATSDSFLLYICTKGSATLVVDEEEQVSLDENEIVLIPAEVKMVHVVPNGKTELIKVSIL